MYSIYKVIFRQRWWILFAIYNTGIITCQVLPLAMMYNFSWGIIHSAISDIYYCHDWARVKQPGKMISLCRYQRQRVRARAGPGVFYRPDPDTIFLVSFTNQSRFTMQSQGRNVFAATGLHLAAPSSPRKRQLWKQKRQRLTEESDDCLHCWNSSLTSWVCPHLADRQHALFSHFFLSLPLSRSYVD